MNSKPIVTTKQGVLRGQLESLPNGFDFYSFVGIPYAQPPIGELRFKAPQPSKAWEGIRDALKESDGCYCKEYLFETTYGSEDCLYLNVYTSKLPKNDSDDSLMPVMVWFHGGAFISGSSKRNLFGPEFLIDKSIVFVTINFRLGALGLLCLKDDSLGVHGHAALKDQNLALKWVQANIRQFGGDPDNVTIFGQSSGAASVCFQMVSPMGKGLFHKAIMQSGVASCVWAEGKIESAYQLVEKLGKNAKKDAEVLKILQSTSTEDLLKAQLEMTEIWAPNIKRNFGPVVETHDNIDELFLPDTPINLIKSGCYNKVPIIIGANSGEGLLMKTIELILHINATPDTDDGFVPHNYNLVKGSKQSREIGAKIREHYYGEQDPCYAPKQILYDYMTDAYFVRAILDMAENIMRTSNENVFMYEFCLKTNLNLYSSLTGATGRGTCHSDDTCYLFKSKFTPSIIPNSVEDIAIQRMTKWWTNFAKYADPNGIENDPLFSLKWPHCDANEMQYIEIDKSIIIKSKREDKNNNFWKSIEAIL